MPEKFVDTNLVAKRLDAYKEGRLAGGSSNRPRNSNPYPNGVCRDAWDAGWKTADREKSLFQRNK